MKRLLRYMAYREIYRLLREASEGGDDKENQRRSRQRSRDTDTDTDARATSAPAFDGDLDTAELAELKSLLQEMDPYDFEHFVADIWARMGWETAVSSEAADKGVDVTAVRHAPYRTKALIQAKRYGPNTTVGSPQIQQYASLKHQRDGVDKVVVVTTNEFTGQGRELAQRLNVKLVNGDDLVAMVAQLEAYDLVRKYLDLPEPEKETEQEATVTATVDVSSDADDTDGRDADDKGFFEKVEERAEEQRVETARELDVKGTLPSTNWKLGVWAGTLGWMFLLIFIEGMSDGAVALTFFTVWILLPLSIYKDAGELREQADWPRYWWAYVVASLAWFLSILVGAFYLWRRYSVSKAGEEYTSSAGGTEAEEEAEEGAEADTETETKTDKETEPESAGATGGDGEREREMERVEHDGVDYLCLETVSNGDWTVRRGSPASGTSTGDDRVFVYHADDADSDKDEAVFTETFENVVSVDVSPDGVLAVADGLGAEVTSGKLVVYSLPKPAANTSSDSTETDGESERLVTHFFNSNVSDCAVSDDGSYAAVTTLNPDCTTYVFDTETEEVVAEHQNVRGNKQSVWFDEDEAGDGTVVRLSDEPDGEKHPLYAIDISGEVVEKSDELRRRERLDELLEAGGDPKEAVENAEEAYELAEGDDERQRAALGLADVHLELAGRIEEDEGVTDECWEHLNAAKERYGEVVPRREAVEGVAEVLRRQGKYYLRRDADEAALARFREIETLEEEHGIQILTDEDERKMDELTD